MLLYHVGKHTSDHEAQNTSRNSVQICYNCPRCSPGLGFLPRVQLCCWECVSARVGSVAVGVRKLEHSSEKTPSVQERDFVIKRIIISSNIQDAEPSQGCTGIPDP